MTHQVFIEDAHPWAIAARVVSGRSGESYQTLIIKVRDSDERAGGYRHSCNCKSWRGIGGTFEVNDRSACDHILSTYLEWGQHLSE